MPISSLANLELVVSVGLSKYGPDEMVSMMHTELLGMLYDGEYCTPEFLAELTKLLNKRLFSNAN
jgi:hypothetical protein